MVAVEAEEVAEAMAADPSVAEGMVEVAEEAEDLEGAASEGEDSVAADSLEVVAEDRPEAV